MAKQRFSLEFDFQANMGPVKTAIDNLQKSLSKINLPSNLASNFEKMFGKLGTELSEFEALTKNGFANMSDVNKAANAFGRIQKMLNQINIESSKVKELNPNRLIPSQTVKRVEELTEKWAALQAQSEKKDKFAEKIQKQNKSIKSQKQALEALIEKRAALEADSKSLAGQKGVATKSISRAQSEIDTRVARQKELEETKGGKTSAEYADLTREIKQYNKEIDIAQTKIKDLDDRISKNGTKIRELGADIKISETELNNMNSELTEMQKVDIDITQLNALRQELAEVLSLDIGQIPTDLGEIRNKILEIPSKDVKQIADAFGEVSKNTEQVDNVTDGAARGMRELVDSAEGMDRVARDMDSLKNSILQFFSVTNAIQLFKSAVSGALKTVKELDATMTEAAVVTEFDVSDMWEKLPTYSAQAQQLGVSINGMYQATTLYYQQGLKTNEAMAIGVETMKMARIAGMESADATKAMTAALRGFNMELNETSATRVNDVYSELAAVTAADTEQIATAMSKTASIAAAANMEFETTAALLAQIIETTQEAPETAGTAMKTIIARFSEVKSLKNQGLISGQDSEGEDIDVNKIQTALKTVGISMDSFFAGTEGLDSILLKLAEKWSSLDTETQRYIATMAAGSRQQSRFIAMMSDYSRTTELVGAANESAGASQKQFEKTLDSMETKLQRLENAWNEFLMGLANNEILKGAVDTLTFVIEGINSLTEAISGGNGLAKSIVSLTTVIAALKAGGSLFSSFGMKEVEQGDGSVVKKLVRLPKSESEKAGKDAGQGFVAGFKRATKSKNLKDLFGKEKITDSFNRAGAEKLVQQQKANLGNARNPNFDLDRFDALDDLENKLKDTGVSVEDLEADFQNLGISTEGLSTPIKTFELDMKAVSQAMIGVGAATGLLSSLLSALGFEDAAEGVSKAATVFMGLGSIMSLLTTIAPILGMSFTSAGIQIATAGFTAQLAWWWVFLIIGAITAIVAGCLAWAKAAKEASDEFKLEKLNEQLEDLGKAADEAKTRIEAIGEARSELESLQDTFSNLVVGSQEWKQALVENNQQVLELLNTYPQLAEYMTRGKFGELTISDAGWEAMLQEQQKSYTSTINAKAATAQSISEMELKIEAENKSYDVSSGAWTKKILNENLTSEFIGGMTYEAFRGLAEQLLTEGLTLDESGRERAIELYKEQGFNSMESFEEIWTSLQSMSQVFDEVADSAMKVRLAEQARIRTVAEANALMSKQVSESDNGNVATEAAAQAYENYNEMVDKEKEDRKFKANRGTAQKDNKALIKEYHSVTNKSIEEIKEEIKNGQLTYAQMQAYLSAKAVDDRMIKSMEFVTKRLDAIANPTAMGQISGLMTNRGLGLTKTQLDELQGQDMKTYLASTLGLDTDEEADEAGWGNLANMVQAMEQNLKDANLAFTQAYSQAASFGIEEIVRGSISNLKGVELTASQTQSLANALSQVAANGGDVEMLMSKFPRLLQGLSGEELTSAVNMLASTNWNKQEDIDSTIAALEHFGVVISEDFTREIYAAANAVMSLNLDKLESELDNLQDLLDMVETKNLEDSKVYTQDEKEKLIAAGFAEASFIRTGIDEYVFTGETNTLLSDINNKVGQILGEMQGDLTYAVEQGAKYSDIMSGKQVLDSNNPAYTMKASGLLEGIGTGKITSINRDMLEGLASMLDIEDFGHKSSELLIAEIKSGYENYYLKLEDNFQKLVQTSGEQITIKYAQEAGSQGYMGTLASSNDKAAQIKHLSRRGQEKLTKIANGEAVSEYTSRYLAGRLGLENADTRSLEEVNLWLVNFYNEATKAEGVMDALIGATAGLETAQDYFTDSLAQTNRGLSENENLIKNVVIGNHKANEAMDQLNSVLSDQQDSFKLGDKSSASYRAALEKVAVAAKKVFGKNITEDFVHNNQALFEQLTLGGEEAQEAFQELGIRLAQSMVSGENKDAIKQALQAQFDAVDVGKAFDAQTLIQQISAATGLDPQTEEQLNKIIAIAQAGGITIRVDGSDVIGVIQSVEGTGLNAFGDNGGSNWENPYDKFYNTYERINNQLRIREKLEKAYQRLLDNEDTSAQDLLKNSKEQLESLRAQSELQKYLLDGKREEAAVYQKQNSQFAKYGTLDTQTGQIQIDWAAIQKLEGTEKGEEVEAYISKLEELRDQFQEAEDALWDIEDQTKEIMNQGRDEYLELENMIKDAIVAARQEEIDKLTAINDTISDTNSKIIDSMQRTLDRQRQARDNEKTEQEIADKQQRLAYLQQDTSGANALEILKLQEEIEQAQEDYTDILIDQKISELQRQNDEAAQQRAQQIAIMEEQLANYQETGAVWADVQELWKNGIGPDGLIPGSKMAEMLKASADWKAMSAMQKQDWAEELGDKAAAASSWEQLQKDLFTSDTSIRSAIEGLKDKTYIPIKDGAVKTWESKEEKNPEIEVEVTFSGGGDSGALDTGMGKITSKFTYTHFKTGGLADFTGPAWLDGSKSNPEYVLNASQTKAFFQLVDVLDSLKTNGAPITQNGGDSTFDIDINVESLSSDYDVEQIALKVKEFIANSSRYRNNNTL